MRPFSYSRAADVSGAVRAAAQPGAPAGTVATGDRISFLAGGTNLLDYMKLDSVRPEALVDINDLQPQLGRIDAGVDGLRLGALVRMSQAADDPAVNRDYPVIAQTLKLAASAQIRNMASLAGNVLQRTRCEYFRNTSWASCNKREPGTGCAALEGVNRQHAVLGVSDKCISTYPGDFAQALVALDARVETAGPAGRRTLRFEELHRGPEDPHLETHLIPGELITALVVPAGPWTRRSTYVKVRDRESYQYGLATAAVALDLAPDHTVREARIGLGGVAYKPWRAHAAEASLKGRVLDERAAAEAGRIAFHGAVTHGANAFKPELGARTVARALIQAAALEA